MNSAAQVAPIVAGVDGSPSALRAVQWAAAEAARRGAPLRLVHVCHLTLAPHQDPAGPHTGYLDVLLDQGRQWLWEATSAAKGVTGTAGITTDLRDGHIAEVLIEESAAARLVVLGSRGLGGFAELLAGPIAVTLAAHAHCPVVVVRSSTMDEMPPSAGPVVVGVDSSPPRDAAVAFAFDAAASRGAPLLAVHAWLDLAMAGAWTALPNVVDWDAVHAGEERALAEGLAGWQEKYPDVEVRRIVVRDRPAHALTELGARAQLIVVGSHGRGAILGLGSVSHALLHHAPCPVAVVRPGASQPSTSDHTT